MAEMDKLFGAVSKLQLDNIVQELPSTKIQLNNHKWWFVVLHSTQLLNNVITPYFFNHTIYSKLSLTQEAEVYFQSVWRYLINS